MGRNRRKNVRADQRKAAEHREALEIDFRHRIEERPELAELVTARSRRDEPYHRWLNYVQGFAPGLVRLFLSEGAPASGPILDPFAGSGTVTTECGRLGRAAVGVDAVQALAFLASAPSLGRPPPWIDLPADATFSALEKAAVHPLHRAAVLLAAAKTVDAEGHQRGTKVAPAELVRTRLAWMDEDTRIPLRIRNATLRADARRLPFKNRVFGGALTSPPYLSRYDYAKITAPMQDLMSGANRQASRRQQVRAAPVLARGRPGTDLHEAAEEAAEQLLASGDERSATLVRAYFSDLAQVLSELHRTLSAGAPLWIVIGSADLSKVYIPADLILAMMAEELGFEIEAVLEARRLRPSGRHLGALRNIAPRESLLKLRKN